MPPPPAHLPPVIAECEVNLTNGGCGAWAWNGSSYTGVWSNGSTGQLTVTGDDPGNLRIERTDTAGAFAGLTATYTGRWTQPVAKNKPILYVPLNGQQKASMVEGAKLSIRMRGTSAEASWIGAPAVTSVFRDTDRNSTRYFNFYSSQLTGYAVNVNGSTFPAQVKISSQLGTLINDYRIRGEHPMNPGESRDFSQRVLDIVPNYVKGANYPDTAPIAAVYSDGATFGDANVLKVMMEHRREMIEALTSIGATVCRMGLQQASMREIGEELNKQHAKEDASNYGRNEAYSFADRHMAPRELGRMTASQAAKHVWERINKVRSELAADPVKDGSGQLVIPSVTPLACSLP